MLPPPPRNSCTELISGSDAARFGLDACPESFDFTAETAALVLNSACLSDLTLLDDELSDIAASSISAFAPAATLLVDVLESAGHQVLQAEDAVAGLCRARRAPRSPLHGHPAPATQGRFIHLPYSLCALTAFVMKGDEERSHAGDGCLATQVSHTWHRHKLDSIRAELLDSVRAALFDSVRAELACLPQAGRSMNGLIL